MSMLFRLLSGVKIKNKTTLKLERREEISVKSAAGNDEYENVVQWRGDRRGQAKKTFQRAQCEVDVHVAEECGGGLELSRAYVGRVAADTAEVYGGAAK